MIRLAKREAAQEGQEPVFVVFDGPPDHNAPHFVEVETVDGKSVSAGEWKQDGQYWNLGPYYLHPAPIPDDMVLDAKRYRLIRRMTDPQVLALLNSADPEPETEESFDAAIDAAIAAYEKEQGK